MSTDPHAFQPGTGLHNPHLQTVLSSMGRKLVPSKTQQQFHAMAERKIISLNGVHLAVDLNLTPGAPLILLIPGWLGSSQSAYARSCATVLANNGFSTARINLRDHGNTAHLNQGLFNSAMIDEVIALVAQLRESYGTKGCGLMGYSLGGNFALRVARALADLPTLAIAPAMAPASTMYQIDASAMYQRYFINKWRSVWREKDKAFPGVYNFRDALKLNTVSALTDYFVRYHTDFASTDEYFKSYDLSCDALHGVNAHILAAADDPIIPAEQYAQLPPGIVLHLTDRGGHGAYLDSWRLSSWADNYAVQHFKQALTV
ncbi:MAG: YheT family hydrolase [bacterium]